LPRTCGIVLGLPTLVFQLWALRQDPAVPFDPSTFGEQNLVFGYTSVAMGAGLASYILSLLLQASLVRATIEDLNWMLLRAAVAKRG
jgi:hypothetical protein